MNKEVLQKYFRKECSESEAAMVEEWLLAPEHQQELERFLEEEWDHHVKTAPSLHPAAQRSSLLRRYLPGMAAAAAVLALVTTVFFWLTEKPGAVEASGHPRTVIAETGTAPVSGKPDSVTTAGMIKQQKTVAHPSTKTIRHGHTPSTRTASASPSIAPADTMPVLPEKPRTMKASTFNKVMINEVALNKLDPDQRLVVLNQMVMNLHFNNASFQEITALLREKYGVVIELCAGAKPGTSKLTARYDHISFSELMNDMSKQMLFTYTFADNKVKVCFN